MTGSCAGDVARIEEIFGKAQVVEGDTIRTNGATIRLDIFTSLYMV